VHKLFRLLGWCLLVAVLLGVLWPERPDHGQTAALGAQVKPKPMPSQLPGPGPRIAPTEDGGSQALLIDPSALLNSLPG
jgi:hypothetical protein